jgi:hypothetical protein
VTHVRRRLAVLAAFAALWAAPLAAQAPADSVLRRQQRTLDSLLATVRALQLRLDSLARRGGADTAGSDDLAALRAAAAAAAGPDTTAPATATAGGRSQNLLNPEISATGDVRGALVRPGPQTASFDPHEFELSFQSALDPFSATKVFIGLRNGEVDVEEGYVYWAGLPGHLRLDVGKFRQTIGELNRWHMHALPEGEYPLVLQRYLGEEGLAQTGVSVYWPLPFSGRLGAYEFTAQVTKGVNTALFGPYGDRPSYLGTLLGFWQFSRAVYGQVSVTGLSGEGHDSILVEPWPPCLPPGCSATVQERRIQSRLGALAVRVTWRPPGEAQRREVTLRGEVYALQRTVDGDPVLRHGAYAAAQVRLGRRWIGGVRGDWVETTDLASVRPSEWAVTPTLTFWQSEFVFLRLQWTHHRDLLGETSDRFGFQAVWAMGPHKHELF